jgi:hypothetical protein
MVNHPAYPPTGAGLFVFPRPVSPRFSYGLMPFVLFYAVPRISTRFLRGFRFLQGSVMIRLYVVYTVYTVFFTTFFIFYIHRLRARIS